MTQRCYPLDDTDYYAEDVRLFHIGRTAGVINATGEDFDTTAGIGMQSIVDEGYAYLKTGTLKKGGTVYGNDAPVTFNHAPADALLDRYDAIVLRYNRVENKGKLVLVKGSTASEPTKYKPIRNTDNYELVIKYVLIRHGISAITNDLIEDAIMDEEVCGLAVDTLAKIPTQQYDRQIKAFVEENEKYILQWFESIKGMLDGDIGVKLSTKIADLELKVTKQEETINKHTLDITRLKQRIKYDVGQPYIEGVEGDLYIELE